MAAYACFCIGWRLFCREFPSERLNFNKMTLIDFATSPLSVLPALLALSLAVVTRKVLLSLGFGVLLGALLLTDFSLADTATYVFDKVKGVVIEEDGINTWNMSIVSFLLLLGIMTALITLSGGTRAFANWALVRIKDKRGASLLAALLGVFIFIDDYFNSLAVGAIARPVTDRHSISRSKLAYILDSTAAPMCILMPLSSWGAYIMTIISGILIGHGITDYSALGAYILLIPMNFYALFTLLMVFAVIWFKLDIGVMKQHEMQAELQASQDNFGEDGDLTDEYGIDESPKGQVYDLILPIVTLIFSTLFFMLYSGGQALAAKDLPFTVFGGFENTDVGSSLCYGALVALAVTLLSLIRQKTAPALIINATWIGAKSMLSAIVILFFAWTIGSVISDMHTGAYLSSLVQGNIELQWLPVILFLLAGAMAFATGTSWGTFGIMLPIAGDMAAASDISLMLPMLSAVLAGSVFGDHCSPISDTTILSSTGARCDHIDHVRSQLPYALSTAFISAIGFIVLGFTGQLALSLVATSAVFIMIIFAMKALAKRPSH
jgi:tetracycline resistance efflux pump